MDMAMKTIKFFLLILLTVGVSSSLLAANLDELRRLAEQGDVKAQVKLGQRCFDAQDYQCAMQWWIAAARQGDATAQNGVGTLHDNGKGVPRDYQEAARWFLLAANQGHFMARRNLGWMYEKGQGFAKDFVRSYMWFYLAEIAKAKKTADAGNKRLPCRLCDAVARKMTPEQVARSKELARNWQPGREN